MLRFGLTGGIGAGKSTVSRVFSELGGIIVDGDVISREVVEPGTEGLAALVEAFGEQILLPDGALNRPALAAVAFSDDEKRQTLNGIVHPLVGKRREELIAAADDDAIIVEDIPLLVESGMAPMFPLVVIVHADAELRVRRLVEHRGMPEADARARIAAQASDEQRHLVADVWLDNSGSQDDLAEQARALWGNRILPLADNIRERRTVSPAVELVAPDPSWPEQAARIVGRLTTACGHRAARLDHIGSTSVPGLDAKDVIDIQVTVASLEVADELEDSLVNAGYPRIGHITTDEPKTDARSTVIEYDRTGSDDLWRKRIHAAADPGRPANIHLRVAGWPNQQFALLFRDWLRANPAEHAGYVDAKRAALATPDYAQGKEAWFRTAYRRAWDWADSTGWQP